MRPHTIHLHRLEATIAPVVLKVDVSAVLAHKIGVPNAGSNSIALIVSPINLYVNLLIDFLFGVSISGGDTQSEIWD